MRTWTSLEGRTMKAAFVEFEGGKAVLKKVDGTSFSLPPSVFSVEDRAYLLNLKNTGNPLTDSVDHSVEFAKGATIVVSVRGEASIVDRAKPARNSGYSGDYPYERNSSTVASYSSETGLREGSILPPDSQVMVGQHSEVVLLFSNGTIATIGENTRMTVKEFLQESFGQYDRNFSKEEEMSSSKLILDLEAGDLVVDVKKLKKSSNFEVSTPLGTAGIRGTVFKIHSLSESAKLSVLTGRVDFVSAQEKVIPTTANQSLFLQADKEPQLGNLSDRDKESMTKTVDSARKRVAEMELTPLFKELNFNKHTVPFAAGLKMLWVEPGSFFMGSPISETGRQAMEARHEVAMTRGFYLGVHEVTQAQYEAVMTGNTDVLSSTPSRFTGGKHPVERVSWNDAQFFLARLNEGERTAGRLPRGWAYVLPTEAEWEYACRAGTVTVFSLGNALSALEANFRGASPYGPKAKSGPSAVRTKPVGSYAPNPWGFYDMHGNVWEWTADWFGRYSLGRVSDPKGSASGLTRIKRGGSWYLPATYLRSASRSGTPPGDRSHDLGFRLAFKQIE
ncbi:MAG: SUMF1/EgtB/PvdO family nonheme iron enzyme [Opitutae bacterium]|nr:SUMF1/EgtB/PvdO family nonheme iron enzyme [Opitutae bacterium]